jgi:hypothetical protein
MLLQLDGGESGGSRLISAAQLEEMHRPHIIVPFPARHPEIPFSTYGLGWTVEPYRGHRVLWHDGGISGFSTRLTLIPEQRAGIAVLSNLAGSSLPEVFTRTSAAAPEGEAARRVSGTGPAHRPAEYAGRYEHPGYGDLEIAVEGENLHLTYNDLTVPLRHRHYEIFDLDLGNSRGAAVTFLTDPAGRVERVLVPMEPAVADIEFARAEHGVSRGGQR